MLFLFSLSLSFFSLILKDNRRRKVLSLTLAAVTRRGQLIYAKLLLLEKVLCKKAGELLSPGFLPANFISRRRNKNDVRRKWQH